jgi:ubiquinone/menaquinone biosynthesis C-methylase UbiE
MPEDHMDKLYTSSNFFVSFVHTNRLKKIIHALPKQNNLHVLDAGCGEGHLLSQMYEHAPRHNYYGVDITPIALKKAKQRCKTANIQKMNLTNLSFKTATFDVVICTEVLEHMLEYKKAIAELKRVLKPGGVLIITIPNDLFLSFGRLLLGKRPIKVPDHFTKFTPKKIRRLVRLPQKSHRNLPISLPFYMSYASMSVFIKKEATV